MSSTDSKILRYLHGLPVTFKDICLIYSPTLGEIATEGWDEFQQYLSISQIHKPDVIEDPELKEILKPLSDFEYLLFLTQISYDDRKLIRKAFRFFTKEDVVFMVTPPSIVFGDANEKRILTKEDFPIFQREIALACAMIDSKEETIEFLDTDTPRVRALKEKMLKGRKDLKEIKRKQSDEESELTICDLIGSLTTSNNGYNLLNIWDISYYAFQDQFRRMNWKEEFNINTRASLAGAKLDKNKLSHWIKTMSFS